MISLTAGRLYQDASRSLPVGRGRSRRPSPRVGGARIRRQVGACPAQPGLRLARVSSRAVLSLMVSIEVTVLDDPAPAVVTHQGGGLAASSGHDVCVPSEWTSWTFE